MVHAHEHFIIYLKKRLATTVAALLTIFSIAAQTTDENNFPQKQLDIVRQTHNSLNDNQKRLKKHLDEIANKQMQAEFSKPRDNSVSSADGTPRLRVSLLTCGPGSEIYEYYGHSAIRVMRTDSAEFDLVFNYGVFDFDSDNFALRFALGETDYLCQCQPTNHFLASYERSGRFVDEQVLNLSQEEARRLFAALLDNAKPENATYRYNFFYDNCATRVRDIIEKNLNAQIQYPQRPTERSFRDAVHFYCAADKWAIFGQDLLLGSQADLPASGRELQFVPLIMAQDFGIATIFEQNSLFPALTISSQRIVEAKPRTATPTFPLSPLGVATILLIIATIGGAIEYRKGKIFWPADTTLLLVQGLAGALVAFMFFFSTHPTVGSNWLVWILNPLPLVGIWWQIKGALKHNYISYHIIALPIEGLFVVFSPLMPQKFGTAIILLALLLLVRHTTNLLVWHKNRKALKPLFHTKRK